VVAEVALQNEEQAVLDEAEGDDVLPKPSYEIASYGSDLDVEGIVRRLNRGEIIVPEFQRDYIWTLREASRFIESLLLGLPVPGVFFAVERDTNRLLVIDGQQRVRTLQFFLQGVFDPRESDQRQRVFQLTHVHEDFDGKTYSSLEEPDRLRLDNSVIHATIVKQLAPAQDDTSVFHIFERLNSGGQKLTPQEMRTALYHGPLMAALHRMNEFEPWRQIFGKKSRRLKDRELVLRFLALFYEADIYKRPMSEFLTKFTARHQHGPEDFIRQAEGLFARTAAFAREALGANAFRPERAINAAVFDSAMVGLAHTLKGGEVPSKEVIRARYERLLQDEEYEQATSRSTADEDFVRRRLEKATHYLAGAADEERGAE
jgi:hypothetical protein